MEEINRITIYLGVEEYPLEFVTLEPIELGDAELITEMGELFFNKIDPENIDEYLMEEQLGAFYEEVQLRTDIELFCPMYEKETIANIERMLDTFDK